MNILKIIRNKLISFYKYSIDFKICTLCNSLVHKKYYQKDPYNLFFCNLCIHFADFCPRSSFFLGGFECYGVFKYNEITRKPIFYLKHSGNIFVAESIAYILYEVTQWIDFDLIIPVPMNWKKKFLKGYNHTYVIGIYLGKLHKKPCMDILIKNKNVTQQNKSEEERARQTQTLFSINDENLNLVRNKKVLLIDDMITTGSTIENCAKVLNAHCGSVTIMTLTISCHLVEQKNII